MRSMIRKLFIEPIIAPSLDGIADCDAEESQIISNLAAAVLNPGPLVGTAVSQTAKFLDEIAVATPATARVLMAYVAGACILTPSILSDIQAFCTVDLTLGMESLYWLVRPRKGAAIVRQDIIHAFTTYRASQQRKQVHMLIRDYIGDENVREFPQIECSRV
jgi:hypothetical protein